jgi:hypothetical protein
MPDMTPQALVSLLASRELRIRTGIVELPIGKLGKECDLAVALNAGHQDICDWKGGQVAAA